MLKKPSKTTMAQRSESRRKRIQAHRSNSHAEAEAWDLKYWQDQGPEKRLSALVAIRKDIEKVNPAREQR